MLFSSSRLAHQASTSCRGSWRASAFERTAFVRNRGVPPNTRLHRTTGRPLLLLFLVLRVGPLPLNRRDVGRRGSKRVLLIAAFAIYVIVTKKLRITRSTTVAGDNARNFGIVLLVLLIPFRVAVGLLLRTVLPASARAWPIPQAIYVALFAVVVLSMAFYFRAQPAPTTQPPLPPEAGESSS